ncbi:NAD(P)H-quinone oxidoreductase [Halieaceae bacterium IMCC14734]|uniref:NAD(P)H-quinone oxidoreductase n=2 Tax=Candidatus Litorirhabdus singularis TaxID=2518993 RepID=A0ABT3TFX5_9GAMM|nr:NAD(P)H-quinone oxidoreductase [Candidatus Litorirhabdus singularis]
MKYIDVTEPGGAETLILATGDRPVAAADEVLIQVAAAGINRADIIQRMGFYPPPPGASPILGLEVAGEVCAVGAEVSRWQVGDKVCALLGGGGYAEYATAKALECMPIPKGYTMAQAAALPEALLTVWTNVMQRVALQPGETFLVHGGSSGIGTTAIQLARQLGCRVFATAGSAEKVAVCERLGAEIAVNYKEQDFVEVLVKATDGSGVDVILDMVGGDYVDRNITLAAADGRIVNIAYLQGSKVEVNLMPVMLKRLQITGSTLRARPAAFKAELTAAVEATVWPWLEAGDIAPVIHETFPAAQAAEAHRLMEASDHIGKLILSWES